jgi:hypothetical protein
MKHTECIHEKEALRAVRSGQWEESLQSHASSCPICEEVIRVSQWMQTLANAPDQPALPNAGQIWWKAQWVEKQVALKKATKPIVIFQNIAYAVAVLALAGLSSWKWPHMQAWLAFVRTMCFKGWPFANFTPVSLTLFWSVVSLFCITVLVTFYIMFSEEELDQV